MRIRIELLRLIFFTSPMRLLTGCHTKKNESNAQDNSKTIFVSYIQMLGTVSASALKVSNPFP